MLAIAAVGKNTQAAVQSTQNTTEQTLEWANLSTGGQSCSTNKQRRNLYPIVSIRFLYKKFALPIWIKRSPIRWIYGENPRLRKKFR
jgi:hypothetical protein